MKQEFKSHHHEDSDGNPAGGSADTVGIAIDWQDGPLGRGEDRKKPNGAFVETVIAIAIDRLEYYQRSKFASRYNQAAIIDLKGALDELDFRTQEREARGVEGTHTV